MVVSPYRNLYSADANRQNDWSALKLMTLRTPIRNSVAFQINVARDPAQ